MLIPRLVLGCGHLTGGASAGESRRLLQQARAAGIRHVDTAPSYGLGTAEDVVGQVFGDDLDVAVTAKIGSQRPDSPVLKSFARRALRAVRGGPRAVPAYRPVMPGDEHEPDGCFESGFMASSFAVTARKLRRSPLDQLLLHESYAAPPAPSAVGFLEDLLADGRARHIGIANGAVYDPALRAACPAHWTMQAAIDPAMLIAPVTLPDAPTTLHTLVKTDGWLRAHDARYAAAAERTLDAFASLAPRPALAILLPYCLAARNVPTAKLIYTSSMLDRLDAVLGAAQAIDRADATDDIASAFDGAWRA